MSYGPGGAAATVVALLLLAGCGGAPVPDSARSTDDVVPSAARDGSRPPPPLLPTQGPARLGVSVVLTGESNGAQVTVTAVRYAGTVTSTSPATKPYPGMTWVAVQFLIRNTGTTGYEDSHGVYALVVDVDGHAFSATPYADTISAGAVLPNVVTLAPSESVLGYLVFEVPAGTTVAGVQLGRDGGSGQTGRWTI